MGFRRGHLALVATLAVAAVGTSAASGASLRVLIRHTPNMTDSNRTARTISGIVIHSTEGRFVGSVRFLQRAHTRGSAHFVVSRTGQIVQLVPVTDVAWHAGNAWWNLHSIGIEHEGWADRGGFTTAEYRASAKLVAYLAHRWGIPLDRKHIIGHYQVPNPNHPGRFGGVSGHTDPGPYWKWGEYMRLVRYYSRHPVLPHFVKHMTLHDSLPAGGLPAAATPSAPRRSTVERGAAVKGKALWWSGIDAYRRSSRHIYKVDFIVDGKLLYTDHTWPYSFHRTVGWDSRTVANGSHMLVVRSYGTHHYRVRKSVPIRVVNPPMHVDVTGAVPDGTVAGRLSLDVKPSEDAERVVLYADGKPVSRDSSAPYELRWDTLGAAEGSHTLDVYVVGTHGHRATVDLPVVVANSPDYPPVLSGDWLDHPLIPTYGLESAAR
ncbi:MAG: N-acetylmuramoyl-L-alanine amidase [Gaiellaceae bacterium]